MSKDEMLAKEQSEKKQFKTMMVFSVLAAILNILVFPVSLFIGAMATAAPDSGFRDFMFGFLFVQIIPFILFLITIVVILKFINKVKRSSFMISFIKWMIIVNLILMPVAYYIGMNAKGLSDGGVYEFIYGFLFIQSLPLIILIISILMLRSLIKKVKMEQ